PLGCQRTETLERRMVQLTALFAKQSFRMPGHIALSLVASDEPFPPTRPRCHGVDSLEVLGHFLPQNISQDLFRDGLSCVRQILAQGFVHHGLVSGTELARSRTKFG